MATAGSIVIDLLMKTGSFETDTKRAEKRLQEMEKTAKKWGAAIGVAAAAAGTAFAAWAVKMADTGKELDRFATLTNASAERFQRWAYGARTVGIEQEKLADILKDTQDRVGDFITTGGGPMADFFEQIAPKIGVTADQFRNLSGPDALGLYVSSLEKAGLSQSEMIFYMEAMASDSSLLIPLLRDNAAGMRSMGDEAERLGAVMSDETVVAAKELDTNLQRLYSMGQSISTQMANDLLPSLNDVADGFLRAAKSSRSYFASLLASTESVLFGDSRDPLEEQKRLVAEIEDLEKSITPDGGINNYIFQKGLDYARSRLEIVRAQIDRDFGGFDVPMLDPIVAKGSQSSPPSLKDSKSAKEDRDIVFDSIEQLLEVEGELIRMTETYGIVHEKTMDGVSEFTLEAARNIQNSLGDGLYNILSGNFDDIGKSFGDMITRMVADAAAANLASALFGNYSQSGQIGGVLGNIAGSLFGGAASGITAGSSFDLGAQSYLNTPPTFASWSSGGYTGAGGKYDPAGIVHRGEYVLNQDATRRVGVGVLDRINKGYSSGGLVGGGSPGSPQINIINNSSQPLSASQPKVSMDAMGRMVIEVMLNDWRRNGPYAKQLKGAM